MEEVERFYAEHDPRPTGRLYLVLLAVIAPAVFYAVHLFWDRDGQLPIAFPYLCLGVPFLILFSAALGMAASKGCVRWIIAEGEIACENPLGESFRMPLSEFRKVESDGDSTYMFCVSRRGARHRFDTKQPGGHAFYRRLKQEQKRLDSAMGRERLTPRQSGHFIKDRGHEASLPSCPLCFLT